MLRIVLGLFEAMTSEPKPRRKLDGAAVARLHARYGTKLTVAYLLAAAEQN